MIEAIEFSNFKALRETTLPFAPFTLLLGPNGSGKSSVLQAITGIAAMAAHEHPHHQAQAASNCGLSWPSLISVTAQDRHAPVEVKLRLRLRNKPVITTVKWNPNGTVSIESSFEGGPAPLEPRFPERWLAETRTFALDPIAIAQPVAVNSGPLQSSGAGLAAVLDDLKDNYPDRWESLLQEMRRWLPEYDHIGFEKPQQGQKGLLLRTAKGGHRIAAKELSQGTLVGLALLALAYSPRPPTVIGLEEIDRGLHPRLLRHLQDALYRLSYPESCGETRAPIQVIATTHSPYLLDLYRDHPEEVVLAEKQGLEVRMHRLKDIDHYEEILGESPLSEVWYSGVLGGVSVKP